MSMSKPLSAPAFFPPDAPCLINIAPLLDGREQQIADDIRQMYGNDVIQANAFCMTLVPEGVPAVDKATRLAELYRRHRSALGDCAVPTGILLQATMGHGWTPDERANFQLFTCYNGEQPYIFCPLDPNFLDYLRSQFRTLAELPMDFFMLDDDTRMLTCRNGCYCPLHLEAFAQMTGRRYGADELHRAIHEDPELARRWEQCQQDSLDAMIRVVRQEMARRNPSLPGLYCACVQDIQHASDAARLLAADGQAPVVRINNARYTVDSPRSWSYWTWKTAVQLTALDPDVIPLTETDTFPHSRCSTSSVILHAQYAWTLFTGGRGGKLWITDLANLEPGAGQAYRQTLGGNHAFYEAVSALRPQFTDILDPFPTGRPPFAIDRLPDWPELQDPNSLLGLTWSSSVFTFVGIPSSYGKITKGQTRLTALSGNLDGFSDDELLTALAGPVLLDGRAAVALTRRGFASLTGVEAAEWQLDRPTFEQLADGSQIRQMPSCTHFAAVSPGATVVAEAYHAAFASAAEGTRLAPSIVQFTNRLGGKILATAYCLESYGHLAFPLFCETRLRVLRHLLGLPMYVASDAPLQVSTFLTGGYQAFSVANLCLDILRELTVVGLPDGAAVENLQMDGAWRQIPRRGDKLVFDLPPADVAFFRLAK